MLINNQFLTDAKTNRLIRQFEGNRGRLNQGYITNLYNNDIINQNTGVLGFLFNRVKRLTGYRLTDYNMEYFNIKFRKFIERINSFNTLNNENASIGLLKEINKSKEKKEFQELEMEEDDVEVDIDVDVDVEKSIIDQEIDIIKKRAEEFKKKISENGINIKPQQNDEHIDFDEIL